jgi:hypothetical protein
MLKKKAEAMGKGGKKAGLIAKSIVVFDVKVTK